MEYLCFALLDIVIFKNEAERGSASALQMLTFSYSSSLS